MAQKNAGDQSRCMLLDHPIHGYDSHIHVFIEKKPVITFF